ncbi:hypothetical protein ACH47X_00135 [Promicromonospora kroppenstedtii]|uniref:DUF559 domain-containing protein n=1 Tax=Promicromonospora kroppenstedtii TaxID=440482 RepID=A0ABW7XCR4_9MICO
MRPRRILPQPLLSVAAAQEGLVTKAQCSAAGLDKDAVGLLVAHGRWRRVVRCVYDTDPTPSGQRRRDGRHDHLRRRAAWTAMLAVGNGIATGACALALLGVDGLVEEVVPEAARSGGMHSAVDGVTLRRYRDFADEEYRGRRIASVVPALAQALPYLLRGEVVAVLSGGLREERIDRRDLDDVRAMLRGRRGAGRVQGLLDLAGALDGSAAESFARLSFIDSGVPPDGQQVMFTLDGVFLARVDFVWCLPDGRYVVAEIDGRAFHSGEAMLADDAERQNRLVAGGRVIVIRFPATRALSDETPTVGAEMADRLRALAWRPAPGLANVGFVAL